MLGDNYTPTKVLGNGSTDVFSFGFEIGAEDNLRVYFEDVTTEVQTLQTSGFTVAFDDDTPGGTVTFATPPTSSEYVVIGREYPRTQVVAYNVAKSITGAVLGRSLDKLTALVQEALESAGRAIKLRLGSSLTDPIVPEPSAGKALVGNDDEDGWENSTLDLSSLEASVAGVEAAQTAAEAAQAGAETAQAAAEASAASINLPSITAGDAGKLLQVNSGETGYELVDIFDAVYPVGSVYISTVSTNPGTLFGVGTWSAFGAGKTLVGLDSGDADFDTAEKTGGAKTHTLTIAEMPAHKHTVRTDGASGGNNGFYGVNAAIPSSDDSLVGTTGGGSAHNNVQPYIVVYMWKRTS